MAVSVLGTPSVQLASGGSYTAETGSNRAVVFCDNSEHGATPITGISLGGVSATKAVDLDVQGAGVDVYSGIWYILEASIPSGSQTLAITGGNVDSVTVMTLDGVDQTSPVTITD